MKRTTDKKREGTVRWRKEGGGSFHAVINGKMKIIKHGQIFEALPEEIPEAFRDIVIPLEKLETVSTVEEDVKNKTLVEYFRKHKGGGKFIVEDAKGKQVNDGYLTKEEAEDLIDSLS